MKFTFNLPANIDDNTSDSVVLMSDCKDVNLVTDAIEVFVVVF